MEYDQVIVNGNLKWLFKKKKRDISSLFHFLSFLVPSKEWFQQFYVHCESHCTLFECIHGWYITCTIIDCKPGLWEHARERNKKWKL